MLTAIRWSSLRDAEPCIVRYLVYKYPSYHHTLTEASKGTLVCQGGPMEAGEAEAFEQLSNFEVKREEVAFILSEFRRFSG